MEQWLHTCMDKCVCVCVCVCACARVCVSFVLYCILLSVMVDS